MSQRLICMVIERMSKTLDPEQIYELKKVLSESITQLSTKSSNTENPLESFLMAKKIEGCSEKTLKYYHATLSRVFKKLDKDVIDIDTEDVRGYLASYHSENNVSKTTVNNIRRILSSFFSWLEEEDLIFKSPIKRIKRIKTSCHVKEVLSDESLEILRDNCSNSRDLAIIDLLASTGIRVGELVNMDRRDIDFENREFVVLGKGDKERIVYFDARTKIHLKNYLEKRQDDSEALFVSLSKPYERLQISGVETMLRNLGRKCGMFRVHPHKFRRTFATKAIDKGMPIEQVQKLLGHQKIDTTMEYVLVNQSNVKRSHRKYVS